MILIDPLAKIQIIAVRKASVEVEYVVYECDTEVQCSATDEAGNEGTESLLLQ